MNTTLESTIIITRLGTVCSNIVCQWAENIRAYCEKPTNNLNCVITYLLVYFVNNHFCMFALNLNLLYNEWQQFILRAL